MTGRPLVAPVASPWFTEGQRKAAESSLPRSVAQVADSSGSGWEPPFRPHPLTKSVAIPLAYRS